MTQEIYQNNKYHCWLPSNEYPNINYLSQAYRMKFLESTSELSMYDFIVVDAVSIFESAFGWKNQEKDLQLTLFYLMAMLRCLEKGGCAMVRINFIGSDSWTIIFENPRSVSSAFPLWLQRG